MSQCLHTAAISNDLPIFLLYYNFLKQENHKNMTPCTS